MKFVHGSVLTQEEYEEWTRAPYACPQCSMPFMRWSACVDHLSVSSRQCHRFVTEHSTDLQSLCLLTASQRAGSLRPLIPAPRKLKDSFRPILHTTRPKQDSLAELQSIQEDMDRAIFRRRGSTTGSVCQMCNMSEANAFAMPCGHPVGACHSCTVVISPLSCSTCGLAISGVFKN